LTTQELLKINSQINEIIPENLKKEPSWLRLEDQIIWYDNKSGKNKKWYLWLKTFQISFASSIPVVSIFKLTFVTAILGALIAILEAIQHLNQFSMLWMEYRSTAEFLKHEKFSFLGKSGPYRDMNEKDSLCLLAERIEEHVSKEHANWVQCNKKNFKKEK